MTARLPRLLILGFGALASCTVPSLADLGEKRCALDAGLVCVEGYRCVSGLCVASGGGDAGPCVDGETRACGSKVGECREGTQQCVGGAFAACQGEVAPAAERCNGKDDNCDSLVDNAVTDATACEKAQGVCSTAVRACVDGGFESPCAAASYGASYQAVELSCDGLDNDCDGTPDNGGVTGGACPALGVCIGFTRACSAGMPGACAAPSYEAAELSCDGKDNDCDGQVDEALSGPGSCAKDAGVCAGKRPACVDGGFELSCTALSYGAQFEAAESKCDGLDNDCDGRADRQPDGGVLALLPKQLCERQLGVCANAGRVCVGGQAETPCTAASYGPLFASFDGTCDGVDNDCDGQVDRSREVALVTSANALTNHISWVAGPSGYVAVYVDERGGVQRVFTRSYNAQLQPGPELLLSEPTATRASKPVIAQHGADFVATWFEEMGSFKQLALVSFGASGLINWRATAVANVTVLGSPRIAAGPAGAPIFVAWIDGATASLRARTFNATGGPLTPATVISGKLADGGLTEQVFDCDVQYTASEFLVGWSSFSGGSGAAITRIFNSMLTPTLGVTSHGPPGSQTVRNVRLVRTGPAQAQPGLGFGLTWVGVAPTEEQVRFSADAVFGSPGVVVAAAPSIPDLSAVLGGNGPVGVWVQGIVGSRLVMAQLRADAGVTELAGDAGAAFAPGLAPNDGGFAVGYESDRGQGLDLYGQVVCGP